MSSLLLRNELRHTLLEHRQRDGFVTLFRPSPTPGRIPVRFLLAGALMVTGSWWTLPGGMMIRRPQGMQLLLSPFLQKFVPELGRWVIPAGIVTVVIGAVSLFVLTWRG